MTRRQDQAEVERLRFEARCAWLDDRAARAKQLNRQADRLAHQLRRSAHPGLQARARVMTPVADGFKEAAPGQEVGI